ncbi:LuxR C-terminal-related transcriptional regulator [Azospirillum brasilense]|uniref:LuxR C-terminal-related transcriptional regulator n=1 Tax=Azospirillum brasilense TaxID=192 RepID=UPI000E67BD76|nr:response regulator transcription factor [Azospirillum brasilense]NUB28769.1 hypothetical protein [Azospirillum brasilense]NUB33989.1 hypothetical protein [Azospirillum brasilense]RIW01500.1 DNA-binding response regulator [Azospirillum brasilense]
MPYDITIDTTAPTLAAPFPRAAVISADHLCGQGVARLIERAVAPSHLDVFDTLWSIDRTTDYRLVVRQVADLDSDVEFEVAHLRTLRSPPVIALVVPPEASGSITTLISCGADLLLSGRETPQALQIALAGVAAGFCVVSPGVVRSTPAVPLSAAAHSTATDPFTSELARLTPRQREIVTLVVSGLPNKLIARRLGISEGTVKVHLTTIFRNFAAKNRTELTCRFLKSGILAVE